jgi:hypothetical protein
VLAWDWLMSVFMHGFVIITGVHGDG